MVRARVLPLLFVLAACEKKDTPAPTVAPAATTSSASSASSPSVAPAPKAKPPSDEPKKIAPSKGAATPPPNFTAKSTRKGGTAVAYRFAIAYRYEGSEALHVELSTHQRGCTDVGADERELGAGESIVDLTLAPQIGKSGPTGWAVMELAEQTAKGTHSYAQGPRADVKVVAGDPTKDVELVLSNGKPFVDGEPVLDGTIVAWGCRTVPSPWAGSDPKPIPHPGMTLEIDGKKLPIQGAIHCVSRKEIVLSTHGLSCTQPASETAVQLTLSESGDEVGVTGLSIAGGDRPEPQKAPVKVTLQAFSFGRETDDVKLAGPFTVAGHKGKVEGTAKLLSCQ